MSQFVIMDLAAHKREAFPESHDKVSYVVNDFVFYDSFIDVFFPLSQLFGVNKIQKVLW